MNYNEIMQNVRADRIEAAIDAAAELYLEQGIDQAKMTDIAQRSQLGVASLYRYFGTKQRFTIRVAARIWEQQDSMYEGVYESDYYRELPGIRQAEELMKIFHVLLTGHPGFLRFVADFDAYIMREQIAPEDLNEYESSVLNARALMDKALKKGFADGTVRRDIDVELFYNTATHSLMALAQKLAGGRILSSDAEDGGEKEILHLIGILVSYIKA